MRCIPDLLIWSVIFFWNFWPTALTLEAQPMSIYNRQFYSKGFQKRPEPSKQVYNDSLCTGLAGSLPQALCPWWNQARDWPQSPPLFVHAFNCFELCQLGAAGDEIWGRGWGSFPMWLPLFTSMGEDRLRGVEVGKIFHYIKRTKEETGSQWPLARPQECANPGNWPLARLLRGCWLGKTGSLTAAKNVDNGLLDILLLKVRLLFYYHQR